MQVVRVRFPVLAEKNDSWPVLHRMDKVSKYVGILDVLDKLYKCQYQHLYSTLTKEVLLINSSDSDVFGFL